MSIAVTDAGIVYTNLDDTISEQENAFRALLGEDLTLDPETPQAQIIGLMSVALVETYEAIAGLADQINPDRATGRFLDDLGALLHVLRLPATSSLGQANLQGTAGVTVPAGTLASDSTGQQWAIRDAAELDGVGVDVSTVIIAAASGPVPLPTGPMRIVNTVPGWETITAAAGGNVGTAAQSDADYRRNIFARVAKQGIGPIAALRSALANANAGKTRLLDNPTASNTVEDGLIIPAHSFLAIAEEGTAADLTTAVESHRGMGVGTPTAIVGAVRSSSNITALTAITNGSLTFGGTTVTGVDLRTATTGPAIAAALTAEFADEGEPLFVFLWDRFLAVHFWLPGTQPTFDTGTLAAALGLRPADSSTAGGPFIRPEPRVLTVVTDITRGSEFPADGLTRLNTAFTTLVESYAFGEPVRSNDFVVAAELVPGCEVTALAITHAGVDMDGVDVPGHTLWTLTTATITINLN